MFCLDVVGHVLLGRYLPGIKLPANVVAEPDLLETVKDAHLLVWVLPHQVTLSACLCIDGAACGRLRACPRFRTTTRTVRGVHVQEGAGPHQTRCQGHFAHQGQPLYFFTHFSGHVITDNERCRACRW